MAAVVDDVTARTLTHTHANRIGYRHCVEMEMLGNISLPASNRRRAIGSFRSVAAALETFCVIGWPRFFLLFFDDDGPT